MKWPRRTTVGVDETPPEPQHPAESVSLVDDALRATAGRQFFRRDEALRLLHQIESEARDHAAAPTVVRIVADVDSVIGRPNDDPEHGSARSAARYPLSPLLLTWWRGALR